MYDRRAAGDEGGSVRTASILLALIVVLGFVSEAGAQTDYVTERDYTFTVADQRYGFIDGADYYTGVREPWTVICLGPLGSPEVPFTATQGLVGFGLILATLIIVPAVLTVRWSKRSRQS
jgi:hypothetical protein